MSTLNVRYNFQIPFPKSQAFEMTRANKKLNKTEYLNYLVDLGYNLEFNKLKYNLVVMEDDDNNGEQGKIDLSQLKAIKKQVLTSERKRDIQEIRKQVKIVLETLMRNDIGGAKYVQGVMSEILDSQRNIQSF